MGIGLAHKEPELQFPLLGPVELFRFMSIVSVNTMVIWKLFYFEVKYCPVAA